MNEIVVIPFPDRFCLHWWVSIYSYMKKKKWLVPRDNQEASYFYKTGVKIDVFKNFYGLEDSLVPLPIEMQNEKKVISIWRLSDFKNYLDKDILNVNDYSEKHFIFSIFAESEIDEYLKARLTLDPNDQNLFEKPKSFHYLDVFSETCIRKKWIDLVGTRKTITTPLSIILFNKIEKNDRADDIHKIYSRMIQENIQSTFKNPSIYDMDVLLCEHPLSQNIEKLIRAVDESKLFQKIIGS